MLAYLRPYVSAFWRIKDGTAREYAWIVSGQILAALGGVVGFRILSSHLTPAIWGQVLVWQTFALLINQVIVGGLAAAALRYAVIAYDGGEFSSFASALALIMGIALLIIAGLTATLITCGWAPELRRNFVALLLVGALGVCAGIAALADSVQTAFRQRSTVALHQSLGQWLRFLIATALTSALVATKQVVLAGFVAGSALVLISQLLFAHRFFAPTTRRPARNWTQQIAKWGTTILLYGWPFAAWGVLNWVQTSAERLVIERSLDAHHLGIYGAASQLSVQPMTMLWGGLMQLLTPIVYKITDKENDLFLARKVVIAASAVTMILGLAGALIVVIFGRRLAGLFVGPQFADVVLYWPPMLIVAGLSGASQVLCVYALARHKSGILVIPRIIAAVVGVVLVLILVPRIGLVGAVVAAASAALVQGVLNFRVIYNLSVLNA